MQNLQTVSADFPHNFSDQQIQETIRDYMTRIAVSGSQENVVIQCYPLIALGQAELQKRQNDRLTRITLIVSFVSLIVA